MDVCDQNKAYVIICANCQTTLFMLQWYVIAEPAGLSIPSKSIHAKMTHWRLWSHSTIDTYLAFRIVCVDKHFDATLLTKCVDWRKFLHPLNVIIIDKLIGYVYSLQQIKLNVELRQIVHWLWVIWFAYSIFVIFYRIYASYGWRLYDRMPNFFFRWNESHASRNVKVMTF